MPSIMEFMIADEAATAIDSSGTCSHACSHYTPLGLARPEADDLRRFDPDAFEKLKKIGVAVHEVEIEDFDCIGQLSHLGIINQFDHKNEKKLHKHAIAIRLEHELLIANASPEKQVVEAVCQAFGNAYHVI